MSCGCKTSGDSSHSCGTKSANGCENVNTCGNSYKLSVFDWLSNINNPSQSQTDFVEVRFKNDRKFFYKNVHNLPLHMGSVVTVESSPGHDIGVVSLTGELVKIQMKKKNFSEDNPLKIYRLANQKDIEVWHESRAKEESVKIQARKISYALNLDMKITDVEFQGDGAKVTFYYTSDTRVDFRQLIKEYASTFRTKIDMKQIGFRQEAAKVGGIGSCGRELCCSTWLTDFRSVNTNAARYQQLSINPQKLAGQCGKLKCCLNYELDSYLDALSDFPSSSTTIDTVNGKAFCIKIDVFKKRMWFAYVDRSMAWYDLDVQDVKKLIAQNKKGEKALPLEELRTQHDIPMKSVDLIQENNMDRFEKKNRNSGKNQNRKKPNSPKNNPNQRPEQKATPGPSERRNVSEKKQQPNAKSQNPNQQPKKFKKKPQPKRDDNA
ncbi:regulatory iron-sulfur-containing complex subunit RicT [Chryseobacterium sp. HSC-36S06]|uniref:PSP1 domain-containing protein n=1 Tax=Chryseobacterium sp. HSC-36S06 TaxID=2910970 RepID=UPI00209CF467|nr:regulatory iron-sulfur-containing complex subunit RicT [Chryseobacterium sp. HSC-36S06]